MLRAYDAVVIASGVVPRDIRLPVKSDKVKVVSYIDVLKHRVPVGKRVAVIGAGGIGFDISDFLTHVDEPGSEHARRFIKRGSDEVPAPAVDQALVNSFLKDWGIDPEINKGGLQSAAGVAPKTPKTARKVYLLQRKRGKVGSTLGKTTGWIHRLTMKKREVEEISGCKYVEVNDQGLVIEKEGKGGSSRLTLEVWNRAFKPEFYIPCYRLLIVTIICTLFFLHHLGRYCCHMRGPGESQGSL